jgi:hypothetical protein
MVPSWSQHIRTVTFLQSYKICSKANYSTDTEQLTIVIFYMTYKIQSISLIPTNTYSPLGTLGNTKAPSSPESTIQSGDPPSVLDFTLLRVSCRIGVQPVMALNK